MMCGVKVLVKQYKHTKGPSNTTGGTKLQNSINIITDNQKKRGGCLLHGHFMDA